MLDKTPSAQTMKRILELALVACIALLYLAPNLTLICAACLAALPLGVARLHLNIK